MNPSNDIEILKSAPLHDIPLESMYSGNANVTDEKVTGRGSFSSGVVTMINSTIGAGLIMMPFAFAQVGILHALLWLAVSGAMSIFALFLIGKLCRHLGGQETSFYSVAKMVSPSTALAVDGAIVLLCLGACCSYMIVIGSNVASIVQDIMRIQNPLLNESDISGTWYAKPWFGVLLMAALFTIPMSLMRSLHSLRHASKMAVFCILYMVFLVLVYGGLYLSCKDLKPEEKMSEPVSLFAGSFNSVLTALPIFIFAYTCHLSLFKVFNELAPPRTTTRIAMIGALSAIFSAIVYAAVGIVGALTLGNQVSDGLFSGKSGESSYSQGFFQVFMQRYDSKLISLILAKIALTLLVTTCYPMLLHPCRDSLRTLVLKIAEVRAVRRGISPEKVVASELINDNWLHYGITLSICAIALVVGCVQLKISLVMGFVGATASNGIGSLFPTYFYIRIMPGSIRTDRIKQLALVQFIIGFILMVVIVVAKIIDLVK